MPEVWHEVSIDGKEAKAFEGKLVSQDPTDKPAEQLLEHIKAEKAKRETKQKILRKPENNDRKKKQPNDGHIEVKLIQPENEQ